LEVPRLSGIHFEPLFDDCAACNRAGYSDPSHYRRHVSQKHDFGALMQKAFDRGIIEDPFYFQSKNLIVSKLVESCKIERP